MNSNNPMHWIIPYPFSSYLITQPALLAQSQNVLWAPPGTEYLIRSHQDSKQQSLLRNTYMAQQQNLSLHAEISRLYREESISKDPRDASMIMWDDEFYILSGRKVDV